MARGASRGQRHRLVDEGDLGVPLAVDGQVDVEPGGHPPVERPGREHHARGRQVERAAGRRLDAGAGHASAPRADPRHAPLDQAHALLPRALEQVHAELLAAEPPAAPRVEHRDRVRREVREVPADQRGVGEHVGAGERRVEALRRRRLVVAPTPRDARAPGPRRARRPPRRARTNTGTRSGIRGGKEIAAPVHAKDVAALLGQLFQEVDAAVHHGDHGIAGTGPPVAVALGGLVAGEGERRALVDQHHRPEAAAHRDVVGGRDAGDAGPADDDLGRRGAHRRPARRAVTANVLNRKCADKAPGGARDLPAGHAESPPVPALGGATRSKGLASGDTQKIRSRGEVPGPARRRVSSTNSGH